MAYRNKTYVCFDGTNDMHYYRLMTAWKENESHDFNFHNAHEINSARDSSQEESIKRQLRERFANSKLLVVLIGENTWRLTKFVEWEVEVALKLDLPIVAVNLNGSEKADAKCPPALKDQLALFVPFVQKAIVHAMDIWPDEHAKHKADGKSGAFFLRDATYQRLGLR